MEREIRISSCEMGKREKELVDNCIERNWITLGPSVQEFEKLFAKSCGTKYALTSCNGTMAVHLTLMAVGVGSKHEVIVPDITYVASANAVMYCGATPVFCDVLPETWYMDPEDVERKITENTKAIMAVHLYGHPCDMVALREIADRHGLVLVEDAAEAHGAEVEEQRVGNLGDVAGFSFYGNKMITTGEGGMCTTNSAEIAEKIKLYRGQGVDPNKRFWHTVIGYNYRMTDLQGAIGCAQMDRIEKSISHRRILAAIYNEKLRKSSLILPVEKQWAKNVYWLYSIVIPDVTYDEREEIMKQLEEKGIETRPFFYPLHQLPPYASLGSDEDFPVSCRLVRGGISLPTHVGVTSEDAEYVSNELLSIAG